MFDFCQIVMQELPAENAKKVTMFSFIFYVCHFQGPGKPGQGVS